jgi:hypothetical protein
MAAGEHSDVGVGRIVSRVPFAGDFGTGEANHAGGHPPKTGATGKLASLYIYILLKKSVVLFMVFIYYSP